MATWGVTENDDDFSDVKQRLFAICYYLGLTHLFRWWNRNRVMILCYHGVSERPCRDQDPSGLHVSRDRFIKQLEHLQRFYRPVSLSTYLEARARASPLPPYSVVLTFDDGFRNFSTVAANLLSARGIPATLFVITQLLRNAPVSRGNGWEEADGDSFLTWDELRELVASESASVTVGSHTCTHPLLTEIEADQRERELTASRDEIRARLDGERDVLDFAYPKGAYSTVVAEHVRACGYRSGLSTDGGHNDTHTDVFALRRTVIGDFDDPLAFAARISGLAWWLSRLMHAMGIELDQGSATS